MITILDYDVGNIGSIANMFRKIGVPCTVSSEPQIIRQANKLVLPGVGSFDHGMKSLYKRDLLSLLQEEVLEKKKPVLGICLGMQLLSRRSEEGELPGLGWIDAETKRFQFDPSEKRRVPHMGWTTINYKQDSRLYADWEGEARFYFVHSYHVVCDSKTTISSSANYGYDFTSSVENEHIFGVQFHPEKSHRFGMQLLKNFSEL